MVLRHVHTYVKYKRGLYKCNDPHCTHFADREFLVGKASLCTVCGQEFILSRESLKRKNPRCLDCSNTTEARQHRRAKELISSLIKMEEN